MGLDAQVGTASGVGVDCAQRRLGVTCAMAAAAAVDWRNWRRVGVGDVMRAMIRVTDCG